MILGILASSITKSKLATNSYESIATITVGATSVSSVEFTSIPSTYSHLQIRAISRGDRATTTETLFVNFNSDTANYYTHGLYGTGATAAAYSDNGNPNYFSTTPGTSISSSIYSATVWDLLDYSNSNKYKTIRVLHGYDANGSGTIRLTSSLWTSTSAISSIKILSSQDKIIQYSHFALYGIKA